MTAATLTSNLATDPEVNGSVFGSIDDVLDAPPVRSLQSHLFRQAPTTIVSRPASFLIRASEEVGYVADRMIVLPPAGFTADAAHLMSPHPELRRARITIKGAVRPGKRGFSTLKHVLAVRRGLTRDLETEPDSTYARFVPEHPRHREDLRSSRDSFLVVRENGEGFYHNLLNLSSNWIVCVVRKELSLRRELSLASLAEGLPKEHQQLIIDLLHATEGAGDRLFQSYPSLVEAAMQIEPATLVPVLLEALNIRETGRHEPCTIFGLILKLVNRSPSAALCALRPALERCQAPEYYVDDLRRKLARRGLLRDIYFRVST